VRLSRYFLPTLKETPADAQIVSHRLMLRAGMVRQLTSGIYNWLPLGLNVLNKVADIVREEMNSAGSVELLMPTLQPIELWKESGREEAFGKELLRVKDRHDRDMVYGPTNEEVITDIFRQNVQSYKQLPLTLYHIQWKFRDEIRPRFGVMRGREFLMKDAYSFDLSKDAAVASYNRMYEAYLRIFTRLGLVAIPLRAETGAIGGDLSHEFHVVAETGESALYYDKKFDALRDGSLTLSVEEMKKLYAAADEQHVPADCPLPASDLREARGIEVGHIFYLGTKYSKMLGANITLPDGSNAPAEMGCYGVGVSRLLGAIIEAHHDDKGIVWPESVAPFRLGIVNIKTGDRACDRMAEAAYTQAQAAGIEVLLDDTDNRAGAKFANMELIGLPWMLTIGPRGAEKGLVELKNRRSGEMQELSLEAAFKQLA
jgi:prolyl-tRNA synthetase